MRRGSGEAEDTAKSTQESRRQEGRSRKGPRRQRFGSYRFRRVSMSPSPKHKERPPFWVGDARTNIKVSYLAALNDPRSSRNANSAALAESFASVNLALASNWAL